MKRKLLGTLILLTAGTVGQMSYAQSPSAGVRCGDGYTTQFDENVLVCVRTETVTRISGCMPGVQSLNTTGSDVCTSNAGVGNTTPSGPVLLPGDPPASEFRREVVQNGGDRFVATKRVYAYPTGHAFIGTTPQRGVKCPADGNDRVDFNRTSNSLRCVDRKVRDVMCENIGGVGWRLEVRAGRDTCEGPTQGPTKPEGEHAPDRSWRLDVDGGNGNRDRWIREVFEWPVVR